MNSLGIIIQARMGSTRLPGKVLKMIGDKPLIQFIASRLVKLQHKAKIVLATTSISQDDIIYQFCLDHHIECFRGSEINVLERYYLCAKQHGFEHIIRLTADNPFTDIEELDNLINLHLSSHADYSHSVLSLPKGVGAEIFTIHCLEKCFLKSTSEIQKEHVNEYIFENPGEFNIQSLAVVAEKNRPDISLTIDTATDYDMICSIIQRFQGHSIKTEDAIRLCSQSV